MDLFLEFAQQQWMLFGALGALAALLIAYESRKGGRLLGVHELSALVNRDDGVVLDLRAPVDFAKGHIANAVNLPQNQIAERFASLARYRSAPVILVCRLGQQSGAVAKRMRAEGFEKVYRLRGGMVEWGQQQMPLVVPGKPRRAKQVRGKKTPKKAVAKAESAPERTS